MKKILVLTALLSAILVNVGVNAGNLGDDREYFRSENIIGRCLATYRVNPRGALDTLSREFKVYYDGFEGNVVHKDLYIAIVTHKLRANPILVQHIDYIIESIRLGVRAPVVSSPEELKECGICCSSAADLLYDQRYVTTCCNKFICRDDADSIEKTARELYQNLQNFEWRRQIAADPGFTGWPTVTLEHGKCPYCRSYPLDIRPDRPERMIKCGICMDEMPEKECSELRCGHVFCNECLNLAVDRALREKSTRSLICPSSRCSRPMDIEDIRKIINGDRARLEAYDSVLALEWIASQSNAKHCPTAGCPNSFLYELHYAGLEGNYAEITCDGCNRTYCGNCMKSHIHNHQNYATCAEVEAAIKRDAALTPDELWLRDNTRLCPTCRVIIHKDNGCKYVTCNRCETQFCWYCMTRTINHDSHKCATKPCPSCGTMTEHNMIYSVVMCNNNNCDMRFCWDCLKAASQGWECVCSAPMP